jgi:hypothetical protein
MWGQVEKATEPLSSVTTLKALMGKTLCKGEIDASKNCATIVIASNAPRSTLIHEYLHAKQMSKDANWCPLSKALWGKSSLTSDEKKAVREKEWDAHKFLWRNRALFSYGIEDALAIASETIEEAQARSSWDASAKDFVKEQNIEAIMLEKIEAYKKQLGI